MRTIPEVVARRSDLGTFLVHLTRGNDDPDARANLLSILNSRVLSARSAYGSAVGALEKRMPVSSGDLDSQRCVCFTETPLEHLNLLIGKIEGRQCDFSPYGVAITKRIGRNRGVNPVWYLDITPTGRNWLTNDVDALIEEAIGTGAFCSSHIARLSPFIEQMGSQIGSYWKEYWWEREWRHVGDYPLSGTIIGLAPEEEHEQILNEVTADLNVKFVDPMWGLESLIARLAGFNSDEVGML